MTDPSFGRFGGQYVPEVLMEALAELEDAYERYVLDNEDGFRDDFRERLREFGGRPTPLQRAEALSDRYDADVYLKREDLVHGGAHKLNNALGQVLLATYMGKERVVAETGAGQHGTATAMAAAHLDVPCEVYMGRTDVDRQRPNVHRMHLNGATVTPVTAGSGTLKEAINETLRDWATNVEDTHYVIGSVVGPHPFPRLVRKFQSVIGGELREQVAEAAGRLPDSVVACTGGGSNAMGAFDAFVGGGDADDASGVADDASGRSVDDVALYAVEAGGSGLTVDAESGVAPHSASLVAGDEGVLHGARTRLLQDGDGQVVESHSVSAGLDYAGVGPELAHLAETGRVTPVAVGDDAALEAFHRLSRLEGVIPALESAHALAFVERALGGGSEAGDAAEAGDTEGGDEPLDPADHDLGDLVVVNLSGRGDKDLESVLEETDRRDLEEAPEMEVFE